MKGMSTVMKVAIHSIGGIVFGVAVLFLVLVSAFGFAWFTGGDVHVPFVIEAVVETENGLPAVSFVPNVVGMISVVLVVAVIHVVSVVGVGRRLATRVRADA